MNISPASLNNSFGILKNKNANKNVNSNYQTQPSFKASKQGTLSFGATMPLNFQERMAIIAKYQKLIDILNNPTKQNAKNAPELLAQLKDDKDCPDDLKSKILLGKDKQAMNKLASLYASSYREDQKVLFSAIEALIGASPDRETFLAQLTTKDERGRVLIEIASDEKELADFIFRCLQNDDEMLFEQVDLLDSARFNDRHQKLISRYGESNLLANSINENFVSLLEDLIEPKESEDEPTIIRNEELRKRIIDGVIKNNAVAKRVFDIDYYTDYKKERIDALNALVAIATADEKRQMFLNNTCMENIQGYAGFKYIFDCFKGDEEALSYLCKNAPITKRFTSETYLEFLQNAPDSARKHLLLKQDGLVLDLLPISYADKKMQIEFLKASPDEETLFAQILALPKLTQEVLELVPKEKREEIKEKHKEATKKRIDALHEENAMYNILQKAHPRNSKAIVGIAAILSQEPVGFAHFLFNRVAHKASDSKNSGFVINQGYCPTYPIYDVTSQDELRLLALAPDEETYFRIFNRKYLEKRTDKVFGYCMAAPNDETVFKILNNKKKVVCDYEYAKQVTMEERGFAGYLSPKENFDILTTLKDRRNQAKFLALQYPNYKVLTDSYEIGDDYKPRNVQKLYTDSISGYGYLNIFVRYISGEKHGIESTREALQELISQDSSYTSKLTEILFNIALDEDMSDDEIKKLFELYIPMISKGDNAQQFYEKLFETVEDNKDNKMAKKLLESIRPYIDSIYHSEISGIIETFD